MVSTHNPFRSPALTPTPTGRTGNSSPPLPPIPVDDDVPARPSYAPPPGPPPERVQQPSAALEDTRGSVADILTEELPPAYTAAPNLREGESTLELGPRRPFQQPLALPRRQELQFPPTSWPPPESWGAASSSHLTDNNWTAFPGSLHRSQTGVDRTRFAPPPQHPTQRSLEPRVRPTSHPNIVSDFARDFYAAGSDDSGLYGGSSTQYQSASAGTSPVSSSASWVPQVSTGFASPSEERQDGGRQNASNGVPDDGRPTDRPVPGHPLLRHGKVLMYPNGYECQKCRNTGYKNYDPSHPCSRCWEKYAKPFSGPITYADWSYDSQSGSSSASSTFQRPLPNFRAPQASLHNHNSSWGGPPPGGASDLSRSATTSRATHGAGGYPGASSRVIPIAGGILPMSSYLDRLGTRSGMGPRTGFPPPSWAPAGQLSGTPESTGAVVVYPPGDPRIGGRLCWRCGGSGKTSFLIFDETTCSVCDGVGRTFV